MKRQLHLFTIFLLFFFHSIFGQEQQPITGRVVDNTNLPLPGVIVTIRGTKTGVDTDADGNFTIAAAPTDVLVFTYLGMQTLELPARPNMTVTMAEEATQIEGVVVTALGISREKRSLGYSAQKLEGADVTQTPTNNFLNNLSGKVAGLEIRSNSNFGGSTNVVLRGTRSVSGNNQALIVVDGVPMNNSNLNTAQAASGRRGIDFGNSAADIDPNNIESITVLKGAAATALYGSQASNGAIMITTKKGGQNPGIGVSYSSTTSVGAFDRSTFPTYQKVYGEGYAGPDSFITADVNGDGEDDLLAPTMDDASYGVAFDPNLMVYQWNAFAPGNPHFGQATPWVGAQHDPRDFFQNSFGAINTININGGDEKSAFNLGFTNIYQTGILPNSRLNKNSITGNYSRNLSDKLHANAFYTFTDQTTRGRNTLGYGDNILTGFRQWWPVNVDIEELRNEYFRNRQNITWNMNDPANLDGDPSNDLSPAYWNNPYWDRYENFSSDDRTRTITGANLTYDFTHNFNILGRVTVDVANDRQEQRKAVGSHAEEFGINSLQETSGYHLYTRGFLQTTYDFIATYSPQFTPDFGSRFLVGSTYIKAHVDEFQSSTTGGLAAPGLYTLGNSNVFVAPLEAVYDYEKFGMYAQASLDFRRTFFLEGSYRRDNTTALSPAHNTYDYWSLGGSLIFSEFIKANWLSLGKLRASYAIVGNDPAYGRLGARLNNGLIGQYPTFGNSSVFVNYPALRNENQNSWEFGLETSMFQRRLNLDLSLYRTNTFNQIINVPQSTSTGYASSQINAGEMQNQGIEIAISGSPFKTDNFQWQIGVNWSKNENELIELDPGRTNLRLASFQSGVSLNATVGQPYGTLRGSDFVYDENGNKVVDENGYYEIADDQVLGNIQADWIAGITNRITYKNLSLNFLIDIKKGGSVFSLDQEYGQYTGILPEQSGLNDLGNPVRSPLTDGPDSGGIIYEGVFEDGTPNNIRIDASTAGAAFGSGALPNRAFVYDASYVKLREVGFSYTFSAKALSHTAFKGVSLGLMGNNLWIIHKNLPYSDPEAGTSSGNIQGYQSGVMPTEKVYSFNIKVNF